MATLLRIKMVEHTGFRNFVSSLNPCFKMVSRNTIKKDCFNIFEIEKKTMMGILEKNVGRVAVTTDMWTSDFHQKGFMVGTAHYIDNNWRLQSLVIRFMYMPIPHTAEVLSEALYTCLLEWNIDNKLSTITVDNCSTNDAMLDLVKGKLSLDSLLLGGNLLHMCCRAHILNLVVKDGLDTIHGAIEKVRDSASYWKGTPKRWEKFEDTARQLRISLAYQLCNPWLLR